MAGAKSSRLSKISAVLFLVVGLFWISIVLLKQGDLLLVLPGFASLISAVLILVKRSSVITRSIALSTGLYNLVIFVYQTYSAFSLIGSSFTSFVSLVAVGNLFGAITFLFLVLKMNGDSDFFGIT